ncbi:MAG: twin-arginine translocase TatA/TatE family subunit [Chloroflexi bacterium]|nr:twin-arginine translocase TatA/TatE family subunit [Chloroflexota bacterium]
MFGFQPQDLIVILIVALIIFGPSQLPKIARALGETLREFRKATNEIKKPLEEIKETAQAELIKPRDKIETAVLDALTTDRLRIFVSSVMRKEIEDLNAERQAAKRALEKLPLLTRPWFFEYSPASPETARTVWLKGVKECDLFVLVIGREMTYPVLREYATARKLNKQRLVFLKTCERTPATEKFIQKIWREVKTANFNTPDDLLMQIVWALVTYFIQKGKDTYNLSANDIIILTGFLAQLPKIESLASSVETASTESVPRVQVFEPESPRVETPGKKMILIPAGEFLRGTSDADILEMNLRFGWDTKSFEDEKPQRKIDLDAYYISETPVTNEDYKKFVDATGYKVPDHWDKNWRTFPTGKDNHPVVNVTWDDANAYARWAGCRLPTEAEWEKAARGTDGRRYPWGNEFDATRCNSYESEIGDTTPVGEYSLRGGNSPYGIKDMAGNVWEWCADWYDAEYYKNSPARNPKGSETGNFRVVRGGTFAGSWDVRCAYRFWLDPLDWLRYLGVRVVFAPVRL